MAVLTEEQIKRLYFSKIGGFPSAQIVKEVKEYKGESHLCIACTQLDYPYSERDKKRILNEWIDFLRTNTKALKALHFNSRVPQALFDAACCQENLEELRFKWGAYLAKLGDVEGKKILDLGCGEGGYSRALAQRQAQMVSIDCSEQAIKYASEQAIISGLFIEHYVRNSNDLFGIANDSFDIVLCSMMLMDCEDFEGTIKEVVRVLRPGGKMIASVLHPCFDGNHEKGIGRQGLGIEREVVVKNYFEPAEWEAPLHRGTTPVIWRHRTMQDYVKTFVRNNLTIVDLDEPKPANEQAKISASMAWLQKIPLFLFWELSK